MKLERRILMYFGLFFKAPPKSGGGDDSSTTTVDKASAKPAKKAAKKTPTADVSIPYDAAARLAFDSWASAHEGADTSDSAFEKFQLLYEAQAVAMVTAKQMKRNMDNFAVQVKKLGSLMTMLEHQLEGKEYIGGNNFTFADVFTGHLLYRYFTLEFERKELENVKAYYDRLTKRATYREHVMVDYSSLKVE